MLKHLILSIALAHGVPTKAKVPLWVAGQFDAATTYYTLNHCRSCYEANPFYKPFSNNPSAFPAMAIGDSLYLSFNSYLYHHSHKAAYIALAGEIALHIYCGIHNIRLEQQYGRLQTTTTEGYPRMGPYGTWNLGISR